MTAVTFRITGVPNRAEGIRANLPGAAVDRGDVVIRSPLEPAEELNAHLVWLWGLLKHERRLLKRLEADGAVIVCEAKVPKGKVRLQPNGAEMLHLLGVELVLEVK